MSTTIRLSKVAPWNPQLRNSYRERFTEVNGRYYKVSAESLDSLWDVEEIDADGETLWYGDPIADAKSQGKAELVFFDIAFRLSDARKLILEASTQPRKGEVWDGTRR